MVNKTLITAIVSAIVFIILCINTIAGTNIQVNEEIIQSVAVLISVGVMWFISHYWNQDYTTVAKKYTKAMRKAKKLAKEGDNTLIDLIDAIIEESERDDD